jgi:hemolysin III
MQFNAKEELANSITHGIGILVGIIVLPILCYNAVMDGLAWNGMPVIVYSLSFIFLFLSSTLYHSTKKYSLKRQLQKLDHIAIYFMIAGSYTPFIFACLSGKWKWIFFGIMWGFVLVGSIFKLFFTGKFEKVSLLMYLAMGWMVVFIAQPFFTSFSITIILLVIVGGLAYTSGVYFYANDHKPYRHSIWHIFVLLGAFCHCAAIFCIGM